VSICPKSKAAPGAAFDSYAGYLEINGRKIWNDLFLVKFTQLNQYLRFLIKGQITLIIAFFPLKQYYI
jgi:hypothetical protein